MLAVSHHYFSVVYTENYECFSILYTNNKKKSQFNVGYVKNYDRLAR